MLQNGSDHILQMEETEINIKGSGNNNPVYETAKETLMYRTVLWTLWERERVIVTIFLNSIYMR